MSKSSDSWSLREQLPVVLLLALVAFAPGLTPGDSGDPGEPGRQMAGRVSKTPQLSPDEAVAAALRRVHPALSDSQIGSNDFRISETGNDGDPSVDASHAAVVYNGTHGEYLVVWQADDPGAGSVNDDFQIVGQRIDAFTGLEIGGQLRISDHRLGSRDFGAFHPAVAYNPAADEYLVVWQGDDDRSPLVEGEHEIFGQRLDARPASFGEVGANDFRISDMGPNGNRDFGAFRPAVVYNADDDEYLVVWEGDDDRSPLVEGEHEIFGQRLDARPASFGEVGANDFRISDMGANGNRDFGAFRPALAYNDDDDEYLVVWEGDDGTPPLVEGEFEIFAQRLAAPATFGEVGANDFRISDMGPDGDRDFDALRPAVAYNPVAREYLVVWQGDDDTAPLAEGEFEIFAQRLTGAGFELGADVRVSAMGPDGDRRFGAFEPAVIHDPVRDRYLVVWQGNEAFGSLPGGGPIVLVLPELEIFGQWLDAAGAEIGNDDFRISDMGTVDGDPAFGAFLPAAAVHPALDRVLVVWHGDDDTGALADGELEVYGQLLGVLADLGIRKRAGSATAAPGQTITYTITVSNAGPSDVGAASVSDVLPGALAGCAWTCAPVGAGASCTPGPVAGDVADTVGLPAATSATYTVTCTVVAGFLGDLINTADVVPPLGSVDPVADDNSATDVTVVRSPAEVSGTKTVSGKFHPGGLVTYELVLVNSSPHAQVDDPGSDEFFDLLPPELTPLAVSADRGRADFDRDTGRVTWNGTIPGGGRVVISIDARIAHSSGGRILSNQGEIFFDADGDGANDTLALTGDPLSPGGDSPTEFEVVGVPGIPTLSPAGLMFLALALLALGMLTMRRRAGRGHL